MKILILKPTRLPERFLPIAGDYDAWIRQAAHGEGCDFETVEAERLLDGAVSVAGFDGVIIAGSTASLSDNQEWLGPLRDLVRSFCQSEKPVFGICYGFELIADIMGSPPQPHPWGRQQGTTEISLTEAGRSDPLFEELPSPFLVQASHAESLSCVPSEAVVLARSALTPVQAFRIGSSVWGVQFHPEMPSQVMREVLEWRLGDSNPAELERLLLKVVATPAGVQIVRNFVRSCADDKSAV